ncbi:MAG: hypothetical protein AAF514_01300 [Verrucomicrobiota bacterium]
MTRATLALVNRSLREDTRRALPYFGRMGLVGLILFFLITTTYRQQAFSFTAAGISFFRQVMFINFFFFTIVGLGYFASVITEEKEEGTLGLLRMTNLNPISILLGKSTSRLFGAFLLVLAQFPFTILARSLGGISFDQIAASYVCLLAYIFLLSNLALFFSVVSTRTVRAGLWTALALVAFFIFPPIFKGLLREQFGASPAFLDRIIESNALVRLIEILDTGFAGNPLAIQPISNVGLGLVLFLFSWLLFNPFNQHEKDPTPRRLTASSGSSISFFKAGRAWKPKAVLWKDLIVHRGGGFGILLKTLGLAFLAFVLFPVLVFGFGGSPTIEDFGAVMLSFGIPIFILEVLFSASRIFKQEIKWKTLSSLLLIPESTGYLLRQKLVAAFLGTLPVLGFIFVGCLIHAEDVIDVLDEEGFIAFFFYASCQLVLISVLVALLSIHLKWGALPLGLVITVIGNQIIFLPLAFAGMDGDSIYVCMAALGIAFLILSAALLPSISQGIEKAAARE